jgi:hypothetical protein
VTAATTTGSIACPVKRKTKAIMEMKKYIRMIRLSWLPETKAFMSQQENRDVQEDDTPAVASSRLSALLEV